MAFCKLNHSVIPQILRQPNMCQTLLDAKNKAVNNIAEVSWLHRADSMVSHGIPLSIDWFGIAAQQRTFDFFLASFSF